MLVGLIFIKAANRWSGQCLTSNKEKYTFKIKAKEDNGLICGSIKNKIKNFPIPKKFCIDNFTQNNEINIYQSTKKQKRNKIMNFKLSKQSNNISISNTTTKDKNYLISLKLNHKEQQLTLNCSKFHSENWIMLNISRLIKHSHEKIEKPTSWSISLVSMLITLSIITIWVYFKLIR